MIQYEDVTRGGSELKASVCGQIFEDFRCNVEIYGQFRYRLVENCQFTFTFQTIQLILKKELIIDLKYIIKC